MSSVSLVRSKPELPQLLSGTYCRPSAYGVQSPILVGSESESRLAFKRQSVGMARRAVLGNLTYKVTTNIRMPGNHANHVLSCPSCRLNRVKRVACMHPALPLSYPSRYFEISQENLPLSVDRRERSSASCLRRSLLCASKVVG